MWKVKNFGENIANAVLKYTDGELKIREATNDEPWGPHGSILQEITHMTFSHEEFEPMMEMLFSRIRETENNWRRVYKGLLVLDYIIKNGAVRTIDFSRDRMRILRSIERSRYVDSDGKDQSINVNHRSTEIISLLNDDNRLKSERAKAKIGSNRIISSQVHNYPDFKSNYANEQGGMGRNIRNSLKEVVTNVVDKIQSSIRMSQKDDIGDLEDEFKPHQHTADSFYDESSKNQKISQHYNDYNFENTSDNLSGIGDENNVADGDFGDFVGNQNQLKTNDILSDIFSESPSKTHDLFNNSNKASDLISFEQNNSSTPQLDDIFSSVGSFNVKTSSDLSTMSSSVTQQQGSHHAYNQFGVVNYPQNGMGLYQSQQQQNISFGLDMDKRSYYSPQNQSYHYQQPLVANNLGPISPALSSGSSSVNFAKPNPMSLSAMASGSNKKDQQISSVDDMIRDSLESFSKPNKDSKSLSSTGNAIGPRSSTMNQYGSYNTSNNNSFQQLF